MKKLHYMFLASVSIVGFIACSNITSTQGQVSELSVPDSRMAELAEEKLSTLQAGYGIYTRQCFQCHTQPQLDKFTDSQWSAITPAMGTHAGITEKQSQQVLAYILGRKRLVGH